MFLKNSSLLFLKGNLSVFCLRISWPYYLKILDNKISFMTLRYFDYKLFLRKINSVIKKNKMLYFFQLKLIGLGFRLFQISNNLYYFYFTRVNYFYFYVPLSIIFKVRVRKIFCLGKSLNEIQEVFVGLLTLKKFLAYKITGLIYPRKIFLLKRGKKKF